MNGYSSTEDDEGLYGDESESVYDEAARGGRFRPFNPKMAKGGNLYKPRPSGNYVTQTQLETALTRVGGQIKTNAEATQAVNNRVNGIGVRLDSEVAKRKKDHEAFRKQLQSSSQMAILPLLLQTPPKIAVKDAAGNPVVLQSGGKPAFITTADTSSNLLPLVLLMGMGGMGGMGGSGGDGKGSDDNNMMMLMVVLLMSQQNK